VSTTAPLALFADRARAQIDAALERFLPKPPACPPLISEAMLYSLQAGGKRLRPLLVLAAADAVLRKAGGAPFDAVALPRGADIALPAACAVEFIHTYSLIHDDLPAMDNDTLRRGRPTLHVVFGDGVAILAGDALQAEAFALLAREPQSADPALAARKLRAIAAIAEAAGANGMVGGQTIDLQAAGQAAGRSVTLDADGLRGMHLRKTGALIQAAATSGAIMAGGDPATVDAVTRWAGYVGLAFQIVDDVLDVEGSAAELGKTAGKDAARMKPTYPALFGLTRSRQIAADCGEQARAVLAEASLEEGWLNAMADWVITRRN
jgi:geranylgeranyl diphosphate synthase, type II